MTDAIHKAPNPALRWAELPTGDVLCVRHIQGGSVEGFRVLKGGKKVRFTATLEAWLKIVGLYGFNAL